MVRMSIQPQPCTNPNCHGQHAPAERAALAASAHPERQHDCLFFICSDCGASVELEDQRLEYLISEDAALIGFHPTRRVIEVEGTCTRCVAA